MNDHRPVKPLREERREYARIRLDQPLAGWYGKDEVRILEMSVVGFRVAHYRSWAEETTRPLKLEWNGRTLEMICTTIRSSLVRRARSATERSVYHSGLRIVESSEESQAYLREIISHAVVRALDEQKANARGVPPLAASMNQQTRSDLYRRCELVDGTWRKIETEQSAQPANGFTVSADVEPEHLEMLCQSWETSNEEGRRLIQQLAELSIQTAVVPTRRYVP